MKKHFYKWITICLLPTFAITQTARADAAPEIEETTLQPAAEQVPLEVPSITYGDLDEEEDEPILEGASVSEGSDAVEKQRKKQFWTNLILAASAVVVAVVSILVVSTDNGKAPTN